MMASAHAANSIWVIGDVPMMTSVVALFFIITSWWPWMRACAAWRKAS
jgi:hypothetical protein